MKIVSGHRFIRALRRKRWAHVETNQGHQKFRSPDGVVTVVVPAHSKDLKKGLQAALMKITGLTDADL